MFKYINNIVITMLLAGLLSCQKNEVPPAQPDEVKIEITSPFEGQRYKPGDTVYIKGNVSYSNQLHGYIVRILDADNAVVYETEGHTHSSSIAVDEKWLNTINHSESLTLELTTVIDHDANKKTVKRGFKSQP